MNILRFTDEILRDGISSYCLATGHQLDLEAETDDLALITDKMVFHVRGSSDATRHASVSDALGTYIAMNGIVLDRPNVFIVATLLGSKLILDGYEAVQSNDQTSVG